MDAVSPALRPIVLARQPAFRIGRLEVRPETCELVEGGGSHVVEPRVMQVLVALHEASGHVVSRDDLLQRCWHGRIVGDDALHRVISRLRQDSLRVGGHFRVETITRVGYRLVSDEASAPDAAVAATARTVDRRGLILGGGALATLAAGALTWQALRGGGLPPAAADKIREGRELWRLGSLEGFAAAQAAFREATAIAPDHSEPWGLLAVTYAQQSRTGPPTIQAEAGRAARAAIARATRLEPGQGDAMAAGLFLDLADPAVPLAGIERRLDSALADHPESLTLHRFRPYFLDQAGRTGAALGAYGDLARVDPQLDSSNRAAYGYSLYKAGRIDEADRMLDQALERWPRHATIWFTQLKVLMFTRRLDRALAMLDDSGRRPVGIPDWNFALSRAQILGLAGGGGRLARAWEETWGSSRKGTGFAENAALYLSATGRAADSFAVASALLAGEGAAVSNRRFSEEQGTFDNRRRRTAFLFEPASAGLRAHPRFGELTRRTGLADYWRESGQKPDVFAKIGA